MTACRSESSRSDNAPQTAGSAPKKSFRWQGPTHITCRVRVLEATYCTARKLGFVPSVCKPVRETHLGIVGLTRGSILFAALHLFLWPVSDLGAQEPAEVVSAETLRIGDRLYRLHGVEVHRRSGMTVHGKSAPPVNGARDPHHPTASC